MATVLKIFDAFYLNSPMHIQTSIMAEAGGRAASLNALMLFYLNVKPNSRNI
jgi:hypothetical protein